MTPPPTTTVLRRAGAWIAAWLAVGALIWLLDMGSGLNLADEAWFAQLLERVGDGDGLYGELHLNVPPLSVWISLPAVLAFGPEAAVIKALIAGISAATALVAVHLSGRLGVGTTGRALVGLGCLAYLTLPSIAPYNPLAYLFLLVALDMVVVWLDRCERDGPDSRGPRAMVAAAGAAAGLSIGAKHPVGFAALAALLVVLALLGPRRRSARGGRARDAGTALAAALAALTLVLLPVAAEGSLGAFWPDAFEQSHYLRSASISYFDALGDLLDLLTHPFDRPGLLLSALVFVIPPLALTALVVAGRDDRRTALTLGLFVAAALAAALPRSDEYQFGCAVPVALVALGWALPRLGDEAGQRARLLAPALIAAVLALTAVEGLVRTPFDALRNGNDPSSVDNMRGALASDQTESTLRDLGPGLRAADRGEGRTFVLSPYAGAAYLVSGISNPTPFDFPLDGSVRDSDAAIISRIRLGEIERVCLGSFEGLFVPFTPERLVEFVRDEMAPVRDIGGDPASALGACTLYERVPPV